MAEEFEYSVYNGDTPEVRRSGQRPEPKRHGGVLIKIVIALLLLAALGYGLWRFFVRAPAAANAAQREGCYTLLIAGTDGDGERTDTMMLLYLDTEAESMTLLSLPRDTLVNLPMSVPKLNGVYGYDGGGETGMEALMEQVTLLLGYRPDGYVLVDFTAVEEVIDLLGGVEFDVPVAMSYSDPAQDLYIDLPAGTQTLMGEQALWVLRYRSGYAMADLDRVAVQRDLVQAVAEQCLTVSNLRKLPSLMSVYSEHVQSDLSFGNLVYLASAVAKCRDSVETETLPGEAVWYEGGSYYEVSLSEAVTLINSVCNPLTGSITQSDLQVVNVVDGALTVLGGATASSDSTEAATSQNSAASSGTSGTASSSASTPSGQSAAPQASASAQPEPSESAESTESEEAAPSESAEEATEEAESEMEEETAEPTESPAEETEPSEEPDAEEPLPEDSTEPHSGDTETPAPEEAAPAESPAEPSAGTADQSSDELPME